MKIGLLGFASAAAVAAGGFWCAASAAGSPAAEQERPAFEAGGYATLDYNNSDETLDVGEAGICAKINSGDEVTALVEVKGRHRLDSLWIDQALVSYRPRTFPLEVIFGQQTFSYGLLTRRLISYPYLYEMVDLRKPGLVVNGSMDGLGGGLGFTILSYDPGMGLPRVNLYTALANLDVQLPAKSLARLSTKINTDTIGLDVAGYQNFWNLVLDYEAFSTLKTPDDTLKFSGFCAGLFWHVTDNFGLGLRGDGAYHDNFKTLDLSRISGGIVLDIKDGFYCAFEFGHVMPREGEASDEIAVELGLVRKMALPGFQRRSLVQR